MLACLKVSFFSLKCKEIRTAFDITILHFTTVMISMCRSLHSFWCWPWLHIACAERDVKVSINGAARFHGFDDEIETKVETNNRTSLCQVLRFCFSICNDAAHVRTTIEYTHPHTRITSA